MKSVILPVNYVTIAVTGALVLLGFAYFRDDGSLGARHEAALRLLGQAKQTGTATEKNILRVRNFLLTDYDEIVAGGSEIERVCSQLSEEFRGVIDAEMDRDIAAYCAYQKDRLRDLESFKSVHSIFMNSLSYVRKASAEAKGEESRRLLEAGLAYGLLPSAEGRAALREVLKHSNRKKLGVPESAREAYSHAAKIFETRWEVDELTARLLDSRGDALLEKLSARFLAAYQRDVARNELRHFALFVFAVLSFGFVLFAIARLARLAAELRHANEQLESRVKNRTQELLVSKEMILQQQQALVASAKLSALGEMAGGVAHEINTPLAIIGLKVEAMQEALLVGADEPERVEELLRDLTVISKTTDRIGKIVNGLRFIARDGATAPVQGVPVETLVSDTLSFCKEKFASRGVDVVLSIAPEASGQEVECRAVEISQVLLNLLNNSFDAVLPLQEKWISIEATITEGEFQIAVADSGGGIPPELRAKIMQPFFTTKGIGKGTGLGLSISRGIIEAHGGAFRLDENSPHTRFVLSLPFPRANEQRAVG